MSEKYKQIGAPMTELPRPVTTGNYSRIESALSANSTGVSNIKFHDCSHNAVLTHLRDLNLVSNTPPHLHLHHHHQQQQQQHHAQSPKKQDQAGNRARNGTAIRGAQNDALHICVLAKEELAHGKDAKFGQGLHMSCPYLQCSFKNSQFQQAGRFPAEFVLNHLHSNHKHRRYNGDNLDLTMVVPQIEVNPAEIRRQSNANNQAVVNSLSPATNFTTAQTWPFVEIFAHRRYFYLEAQSFTIDGHPELFLWLWFLGTESEELHYRYQLTVIHGKSEYTYKGPVMSLVKSATDVKNEGRCLVIREKVWDYMSYKLKITKH